MIAWDDNGLFKGGKGGVIEISGAIHSPFYYKCSYIPVTLCQKLERLIMAFWWSHNIESRGIMRMS